MDIEGKDYLVWLHELRKKRREEEKKSGLSSVQWIDEITQEAEKIIGKKILKLERKILLTEIRG